MSYSYDQGAGSSVWIVDVQNKIKANLYKLVVLKKNARNVRVLNIQGINKMKAGVCENGQGTFNYQGNE